MWRFELIADFLEDKEYWDFRKAMNGNDILIYKMLVEDSSTNLQTIKQVAVQQ